MAGLREVRTLLTSFGQNEWSSGVRLVNLFLGLLYCQRNAGADGLFTVSGMALRSICPKFNRPKSKSTVKELLPLLCKIGILEVVQSHSCYHVNVSATYKFTPPFFNRKVSVTLTLRPCQRARLESAGDRLKKGLFTRFPFLPRLAADLLKIKLSDEREDARFLREKKYRHQTSLALAAMHDGNWPLPQVHADGTITHLLSSFPKDLRPFLLLAGEPIFQADLSSAYHCFFPRLIEERLQHTQCSTETIRAEQKRLVADLSSGDFYNQLLPGNRAEGKDRWNIALNSDTEKARRDRVYRRFGGHYPFTLRIIEDIKRKDRRNISKILRRLLSEVVNNALLDVQRQGIPAIPISDCLICRVSDKSFVAEVLGRHMFRMSCGVSAKVGGIRYNPYFIETYGNKIEGWEGEYPIVCGAIVPF